MAEKINNGKTLSIVILSYNSLPLLDKCIRSIYQYNDIADALEVVVVDNCSANQDDIKIFLNANFPEVRVLLNTENKGYGAGNNIGIKQSSADIVLLMNPDVELCQSIFKSALQDFETDPHLALLGMEQKNQYGKRVHSFLMRRLAVSHFLINFFLQKIRKFCPAYSVISGACFFLRKSQFLYAGGYDETVFLYGEERILHERIISTFPDARIKIDWSKSYVHPISERTFSLKTVNLGLTSYFHLNKQLGFSYQSTFKNVLRYYKFLVLFYRLKRNQKAIEEVKQTIELLTKEFSLPL